MPYTTTDITKIVRRANCCFADLAFDSVTAFSIGSYNKALCTFEKAESLYHEISALKCYIEPDTIVGEYLDEACSDSNTVVDIFGEPVAIDTTANLEYTIDSLTVNTVDITSDLIDTTDTDLTPLFTDITVSLANATGVNWTFSQSGDFDFELCAPCTIEGTIVTIFITVTDLDLLQTVGTLSMTFTLACELDPDNVVTHTSDMNCIVASEVIEKIDDKCDCCSCKDSPYDLYRDVVPSNLQNRELRDDGNYELRD